MIGPIGRIGRMMAVRPAQVSYGYGFGVVFGPDAELALAQEVLVVQQELSRLARATLTSRSSVWLEVAAARLPSAMFWRPLRAACTIWSFVRERGSTKRSQNFTVAS